MPSHFACPDKLSIFETRELPQQSGWKQNSHQEKMGTEETAASCKKGRKKYFQTVVERNAGREDEEQKGGHGREGSTLAQIQSREVECEQEEEEGKEEMVGGDGREQHVGQRKEKGGEQTGICQT